MREYYARLEEVYSGSRTDPEFWGEAKAYRRNKVLGERMESGVLAQYCFTYRILDQDSLTVGERDRFLQAVMSAAQNTLEEQVEKSGGIEAFQQALKTAALQVSDGKIEFTAARWRVWNFCMIPNETADSRKERHFMFKRTEDFRFKERRVIP